MGAGASQSKIVIPGRPDETRSVKTGRGREPRSQRLHDSKKKVLPNLSQRNVITTWAPFPFSRYAAFGRG